MLKTIDAFLDDTPVIVSIENNDGAQPFRFVCKKPDGSESVLRFGDVEAMEIVSVLNDVLQDLKK